MRTGLTALAAAAVLSLALAASGSASLRAGFTPSAIAGSWTGSWTNLTFGTTGAASMTATVVKVKPKRVKVKGRRKPKLVPQPPQLRFSTDFGGNVFGCSDPEPEAATITRGTGPNHWSPSGFEVKGASRAFGTIDLVYDYAAQTLTGGGGSPPCALGLSWTIDGRFPDPSHFAATVQITLPNGQPATSAILLMRG